MSTLQPAELVRVSVHGPSGRADLAVPVSTTVADLMPVLLQYTGDDDATSGELLNETDWVLQRLGRAPLDADGTPETLDWLEGEHFYLRPAGDAMPEMDFDDVADGLATAFAKQRDRWRPEFSSWLFVAAAGAAALAAAMVIALPDSGPARLPAAVLLTLLLGGAAVVAGRSSGTRVVVALFGVSACGFAWLAGEIAAHSPGVFVPDPPGALVAGALVAAVGGILLGFRATIAEGIPFLPFGLAVLSGLTVAGACALHLSADLSGAQSTALVCTFYLGVASYAPRIVLRMAKLHGPQLPRTAEDLQHDIDPLPADDVLERANSADRYLSVLMIVTFGVLIVASIFLLETPGWAPTTLVALFALTSALRARVHLTIAQRVSLAAGGMLPGVLLVGEMAVTSGIDTRAVILLCCLLGIAVAVTAALRPPLRRPRPVWGHLANIVESVAMVAMLPVLLAVMDAYAWARGLGG
jgi:type VII secretion integral membrane protein EccD